MSDDWKADLSKQCCAKCHFLVKHPPKDGPVWLHVEPTVGKSIVDDWARADLADGVFERFPDDAQGRYDYCYGCDNEVWDSEKSNAEKMDVTAAIVAEVTRDRGRGCFYYAHTPGTSLGAAKVLEERKVERREARDDRTVTREQGRADRKLTRKSLRQSRNALWVAVGALIFSILATVANLVWNIW